MIKPHAAHPANPGVLLNVPSLAPQAAPTVRVLTGSTYVLTGTFSSAGVLYAYGSNKAGPAAQVLVTATAVNDGELKFFSDPSSGSKNSGSFGATLQVSGALTNNGTIFIDGGSNAYSNSGRGGATLIDTGTLINAGTLEILAATPSAPFAFHGTGAYARIAGTLDTSGLLLVQGGGGDTAGGAPSGTLLLAGVLTNTGIVIVGTAQDTASLGGGGILNVEAAAAFSNAGLLQIQGGFSDPDGIGVYNSGAGSNLGATMLVAGALSNTGTLSLQGGGASYMEYGQGGQLQIASSGVVTNNGLLQVLGSNGGGPPDLAAGRGATLTNAGALTNAGSLLIGASVTAGERRALPGAGLLNNTGVLTNTGALTIAASTGTYLLLPGRPPSATLANSGTLANAGQIAIGGGGYAGLGGLLLDTGLVRNTGTIAIAGGAGALPAADTSPGGTLAVAGILDNAGLLTLDGGSPWATNPDAGHGGGGGQLIDTGTLTNTGTILLGEGHSVGQGSNLFLSHPGYGATLSVAGTLTNRNLINVGTLGAGLGASLIVEAGGTLTNSGHINVNAGFGANQLSVQGVLDNAGVIELSGATYYETGASADSVSGTLVNTGLLIVENGDIPPSDANPSAGATLTVTGVLVNQGSLVVKNGFFPGYYAGGHGGQLVIDGSLLNAGTLTIEGAAEGYAGSVYVTGTLANTGYIALQYRTSSGPAGVGGGVLTDNGVFVNSGTIGAGVGAPAGYGLLKDEASLANQGLIRLTGEYLQVTTTGTLTNTAVIVDSGSRAGFIDNQGVLINTGTIALAGAVPDGHGGYKKADFFKNTGTLINRGTIAIAAGATPKAAAASLSISATGLLLNAGTISGTGTLDNAGTIISAGGSAGVISISSFLNDGTVEVVPSSVFLISSSLAADAALHGVFDISSNADLELRGAVASSQQIAFAGSNSTLLLANTALFQGILAGIAPQTNIDFLRLAVTSATATNDTLAIGLASGATLDLTLAAPLAPTTTLHLSSDGHGGTELHFGSAGSIVAAALPHPSG